MRLAVYPAPVGKSICGGPNMERDEYSGATLGELMFALTEETERLVQNKIDAHVLAAYILSDLFGQSVKRSETWH
jgi:hypothetical protein